jgi:hypothetical protein
MGGLGDDGHIDQVVEQLEEESQPRPPSNPGEIRGSRGGRRQPANSVGSSYLPLLKNQVVVREAQVSVAVEPEQKSKRVVLLQEDPGSRPLNGLT